MNQICSRLFLSAALAPLAQAQGSLPSPQLPYSSFTNYPAGTSPLDMAVGDLDGDGLPDAMVSQGAGPVLVFRGLPGGRLAEPYSVTRPNHNIFRVLLADLTGDGVLDACLAEGIEWVHVLIGEGQGRFRPAAHQFVSNAAFRDLAVLDADGDGNPDLAAADQINHTLQIFLGDGAGGLTPAPSISLAGMPWGLAAGDVTNDGVEDLVVVAPATLTGQTCVQVYQRGAGGVYFLYWSQPAPDVTGIALGDLDAVNGLDAVVTRFGTQVQVLDNDGSGQLGPPRTLAGGLGIWGKRPVIADVDQDGRMDVVQDGMPLRVFYGDGAGNVQEVIQVGAGDDPGSVAVADVDQDGTSDFLALNQGSDNVSVIRSLGRRRFEGPARLPIYSGRASLMVEDLVGGHGPDLILTSTDCCGGFTVELAPNFGQGRFLDTWQTSVTTQGLTTDLDLNGTWDLVGIDADCGGRFCVYELNAALGDGLGHFPVQQATTISYFPQALEIADFDADGWPDVVALDDWGSTVEVFLGDGTGRFPSSLLTAIGAQPLAMEVLQADPLTDAHPDLVLVHQQSRTQSLLLGDGAGGFTLDTVWTEVEPTSVVAADLGQDGLPDLLVMSPKEIQVLRGNGRGGFLALPPMPGSVNELHVRDLDGDGLLDLVGIDRADAVLWKGRGQGLFHPPVRLGLGGTGSDLAITDLDQDGLPDLVFSNATFATVLFHR